jgi:DNA-binding PadR family transcriptional regulator
MAAGMVLGNPAAYCACYRAIRLAHAPMLGGRFMKSHAVSSTSAALADRDLYSGLIRLHVLHHAVEEPIFRLGMAEELARRGYKISAGTLHPLLRGLERKGYLRSWRERSDKSVRPMFRATPLGRQALEVAKLKIRGLFAELLEGD